MAYTRVLVALVLIALAAPVGGAIFVLGAESVTTASIGVATFLLVLFVIVGIGRGMHNRERPHTVYW